jgi:hypothetical protein
MLRRNREKCGPPIKVFEQVPIRVNELRIGSVSWQEESPAQVNTLRLPQVL